MDDCRVWVNVVGRLRVGEGVGGCSVETEGGKTMWVDVVWRLREGDFLGGCGVETEGG